MWSVWLVFCDCGFHSVCPLGTRIRDLWKLPDGRDWLWGNLGLALMGRPMLSKSLIQFSLDGWGCLASGQTGGNGKLLQKDLCQDCCVQGTWPHSRPLLTQVPARDSLHSQTSLAQSLMGDCSCLLGPSKHKVLFVPFKSLFPQSVSKFACSLEEKLWQT